MTQKLHSYVFTPEKLKNKQKPYINMKIYAVVTVQFSRSAMSDSLQPHGLQPAHQASLCITNSRSLVKLTSIELVMSSNHLILCHPLLLLPSVFPSIIVQEALMKTIPKKKKCKEAKW